MQVIYIAPLKAIVRERMNDWRKRLVSQLGKHMVLTFVPLVCTIMPSITSLTWLHNQVEMTGEYTPDLTALLAADIIISTPEKWDGISRNWHTRSYVKKVNYIFCSVSVDKKCFSFLLLGSEFACEVYITLSIRTCLLVSLALYLRTGLFFF